MDLQVSPKTTLEIFKRNPVKSAGNIFICTVQHQDYDTYESKQKQLAQVSDKGPSTV